MSTHPLHIRPATVDDIPALVAIEDSASALFLAYDTTRHLAHAGMPASGYARALSQETIWVAESLGAATLIGFVMTRLLEDGIHITELSVAADWQRQGVGRALIEHVILDAQQHGKKAITLTTFRDIPWNAPWYRSLGFQTLSSTSLDDAPWLKTQLSKEQPPGCPLASRCAMRFSVPPN